MASSSKVGAAGASADDVKNLINGSIAELRQAIKAEGQKFFPNGIELIEITVKVTNIEVAFKVAGPKAASHLSDLGPNVARTHG